MIANPIIRFLLIFLLGGILAGGLFGLILAFGVFGLIYSPETLVIFSLIIGLFFIPGVYRAIRQRKYLVIAKYFFEILFLAAIFNMMFVAEAGLLNFTKFDYYVIYACVGMTSAGLTIFIILDIYFPESWLGREINHIIKGMQIYGLLPEDEKKESNKR